MYGLPGFESGDEVETIDFERLSEAKAIQISDTWFGQPTSSAKRLDTERDDSFLLQTLDGLRSLKVAHPADTSDDIELQLLALRHSAKSDPSLPLQEVVETPDGRLCLELPTGRIARMLEWLPGQLWMEVPTGPAELDALGDALGRLSFSLSTFTHARAAHLSAWDLQTVPRLAALLEAVPDDAAAEAIARFGSRVQPRIADLPTQVIHNDFNPRNVLVSPGDPRFVVGILDFGDVVHSMRVADLAIAISYAIFPIGHSWAEAAAMTEGFERHVPLADAERAALADLVAARFAQRILINTWRAQHDNETYDDREAITAALRDVLETEA